MMYTALTPKAIIIVLLFGGFLLPDRSCSQSDQSVTAGQDRHNAAMKDLGKNTHYEVRRPF
jgi:hypothetical protein